MKITQNTVTCSKTYAELPFAHRQHKHKGHCRLIHGHSWDFKFTFAAAKLDDNGFVIDFGALKPLKAWIDEKFDHTLVLNQDDPWLAFFKFHLVDSTSTGFSPRPLGPEDLAKITVVPNCGAEGLAEYLHHEVTGLLEQLYFDDVINRGLCITEVTVFEDSKNSATFSSTVVRV